MITNKRIEEFFDNEFLPLLMSGRDSKKNEGKEILEDLFNIYKSENSKSTHLLNILAYKKILAHTLLDIVSKNESLSHLLEKDRNFFSLVLEHNLVVKLNKILTPVERIKLCEGISQTQLLGENGDFKMNFENFKDFESSVSVDCSYIKRDMMNIFDKKYADHKNDRSFKLNVSSHVNRYLSLISNHISNVSLREMLLKAFSEEYLMGEDLSVKKMDNVIDLLKEISPSTMRFLAQMYKDTEYKGDLQINLLLERALSKKELNSAVALFTFNYVDMQNRRDLMVKSIFTNKLEESVLNYATYRHYTANFNGIKEVFDIVSNERQLINEKKALIPYMSGELDLAEESDQKVFFINNNILKSLNLNIDLAAFSTSKLSIINAKEGYIVLSNLPDNNLLSDKEVSMAIARTIFAIKEKEITPRANVDYFEKMTRSLILEKKMNEMSVTPAVAKKKL